MTTNYLGVCVTHAIPFTLVICIVDLSHIYAFTLILIQIGVAVFGANLMRVTEHAVTNAVQLLQLSC